MTIVKGKTSYREDWIDIYRGLSILLVVICHLFISEEIFRWILLFIVYGFMFISGVTFKVKEGMTYGKFLLKNLNQLIIPYLFFAFLWDATYLATQLYTNKILSISLHDILIRVLSFTTGGDIIKGGSIGACWFLLSLFIVRFVFLFLVKYLKNNKVYIGIVCVGLFLLEYVFNNNNSLPFKIFSTLTLYIFMYEGYIFKTVSHRLKEKSILHSFFVCIFFFIVSIFASKIIDARLLIINNSIPENFFMIFIGGTSGCLFLFYLSLLVSKLALLKKYIIWCGMESLLIMGIHSEIRFFMYFLFKILSITLPKGYLDFINFSCTMMLMIPMSYLFNRYLPKLVGK